MRSSYQLWRLSSTVESLTLTQETIGSTPTAATIQIRARPHLK